MKFLPQGDTTASSKISFAVKGVKKKTLKNGCGLKCVDLILVTNSDILNKAI